MVQFSCLVVSYSLQPQGLQHACPSPIPEACSDSCPSSQWCQPSHPLSSPSPPAFNLFQHRGLFQWVSSLHPVAKVFGTSASVLPKNIQDWFPSGWTGWISLQSKGLSRVFSNTTVQKHQFFRTQFSSVQLSHPYTTTGKTIAWACLFWIFHINVII